MLYGKPFKKLAEENFKMNNMKNTFREKLIDVQNFIWIKKKSRLHDSKLTFN